MNRPKSKLSDKKINSIIGKYMGDDSVDYLSSLDYLERVKVKLALEWKGAASTSMIIHRVKKPFVEYIPCIEWVGKKKEILLEDVNNCPKTALATACCVIISEK